ncbi:MAG: hypothetical protein JWO96_321 [Candidatus Saccharibacteria bacterium]|nr:hypothetical protein [Candidatus Saccharibacteria bacterium]
MSRKHLFLFLIFLLFTVATQSGWLKAPAQKAQESQPGLYSIHSFVDGDTIIVDMGGHTETIRMIGVDTPETHKPNTPVQCYGPEASNYTKNLIGADRVRLQADPLDTNRDRYGRLLRYVYLPDGTLVEDKLIAQGYGFAYTQFPFQKKQQFVDEESQAGQAKLGLWGSCTVNTESNGRHQTQPKA